MSDFSRSDLGGVERQLDRIAEKLSGGMFSQTPGTYLQQMNRQLDEVINLRKEVSGKLDRR